MQSNALRRREVELFVILAGQGVGYDRISLRRRANETENLANNRGIWGMSAQTAPAAPQPDVAELLAAGLQHHQAGRLAKAEADYRRVLGIEPEHADVLHLLGGVAS